MLKDDSEKALPSPAAATWQPDVQPPPYASSSHSRHPSTLQPKSDHVRRPSSTLKPLQPVVISNVSIHNGTTNHVAIKTKNEPINGQFSIDPTLPIPDLASEFKSKKGKRRKGNSFRPDDDMKTNALFETRRGPVNLELRIVGQNKGDSKARVDIRSDQGDVQISVPEIQEKRNVSLDIETRRGNITVFIPRTYDGPINLYSKRGNLVFLPILTSRMRIIKAKEDEALVMIVPSSGASGSRIATPGGSRLGAAAQLYDGDFARLTSRTGNIIVGLLGEDTIPTEKGWWKKLTSWLSGE